MLESVSHFFLIRKTNINIKTSIRKDKYVLIILLLCSQTIYIKKTEDRYSRVILKANMNFFFMFFLFTTMYVIKKKVFCQQIFLSHRYSNIKDITSYFMFSNTSSYSFVLIYRKEQK